MSIDNLTFDIFHKELFIKLSFDDILNLRLCNKFFHSLINHRIIVPTKQDIVNYKIFKEESKFLEHSNNKTITTEKILLLEYIHSNKDKIISMYKVDYKKLNYKLIISSYVHIDSKTTIKHDINNKLKLYNVCTGQRPDSLTIIHLYRIYLYFLNTLT